MIWTDLTASGLGSILCRENDFVLEAIASFEFDMIVYYDLPSFSSNNWFKTPNNWILA